MEKTCVGKYGILCKYSKLSMEMRMKSITLMWKSMFAFGGLTQQKTWYTAQKVKSHIANKWPKGDEHMKKSNETLSDAKLIAQSTKILGKNQTVKSM